MNRDDRFILAYLRDHVGQWFSRPQLCILLNRDPANFGEAAVNQSLAAIERAGIRLEYGAAGLGLGKTCENIVRLR